MDRPRLVYMANQIGRFFVTEDAATAVPGIADHIRKFWDPRMRHEIVAHLQAGGDGLDGPVREAVAALAREDA
jgi:formate dehydrogenase subunit delta